MREIILPTPQLPAYDPSPEFYQVYDRILIEFSGGKNSLASFLHLLGMGVRRERIELHHHLVDGDGRNLMAWPITLGYCKAIAEHFGVPLLLSYKAGGFAHEAARNLDPIGTVRWQNPDGTWNQPKHNPGKYGIGGYKHPYKGEWLENLGCNPKLTSDITAWMIRNSPRFNKGLTLVVSGERVRGVTVRSKSKGKRPKPPMQFEEHVTDNRLGTNRKRQIDHFRPAIGWDNAEVWDIIRWHGVVPHPAYELGFAKVSCRQCPLATRDDWATLRVIYPEAFEAVAEHERSIGYSRCPAGSVYEAAKRGKPHVAALTKPDLVAFANQTEWTRPIVTKDWQMPDGAIRGMRWA